MKDQSKGIYDTGTITFFITLCAATLALLLIKKGFIENQTTAFLILDERGEMGAFHAVSALQYITIPLVYAWKFTVIAFAIWVGCFMFGYKISYSETWKVALISESVFLIPEFLKICWFLFIETDPNIYDIREFYPLSAINLANTDTLADKFFYPLKALNIFEVIYWALLAEGIFIMSGKRRKIAYAIVFSSYVLFFLIWLAFYIGVYK